MLAQLGRPASPRELIGLAHEQHIFGAVDRGLRAT